MAETDYVLGTHDDEICAAGVAASRLARCGDGIKKVGSKKAELRKIQRERRD